LKEKKKKGEDKAEKKKKKGEDKALHS